MPKAKKQKNGKWRCQLYLGDEVVNGKRKQIIKSFTAPTRSEAEDRASEYRRTHGCRQIAPLTVSEALRRYIDSKTGVLSETTLRAYESQAEHYYCPLGNIRIDELSQEQVQLWLSDFSLTHSRSTCKKASSLLNSALHMFNAGFDAAQLTHKQEAPRETYTPTSEEVWMMYNSTPLPDLQKAILLGAFAGLRVSEMCALIPADIDYKNSSISVSKSQIFTRSHEWIIKPIPKNHHSIRTVPVPQFVLTALQDGVITSNPTAIGNAFKRLSLKVCGHSFGIHTTRHFYASQLHYAGIPQRTIERLGGWKPNSPVLSRIYQNSIKDEERKQEQKAVEILAQKNKGLGIC